MAKNLPKKQTSFDTITQGLFPAQEPVTRDFKAPQKKERQSERLQLTITPTTKILLSQYAADHDTTMNAVILELVHEFLLREGYTEV